MPPGKCAAITVSGPKDPTKRNPDSERLRCFNHNLVDSRSILQEMTELGKISALLKEARSDRELIEKVRSDREQILAELRQGKSVDVRLHDGRVYRIKPKPTT